MSDFATGCSYFSTMKESYSWKIRLKIVLHLRFKIVPHLRLKKVPILYTVWYKVTFVKFGYSNSAYCNCTYLSFNILLQEL